MPRKPWWIISHVFLPFMVAYLLSELYRNINAIVGPIVQAELGLSIAYLGWMTSLFLAAVSGAQVFTGIWLDRYGARRTVAGLLLVGALGAVLFASGKPSLLLLGRFLIGVGMAGCWTAAFKVNAQWWRPERLALANGMIIGCAGLGALFSTLPTQILLNYISWGDLFLGLAGVTLLVSAVLLRYAPDHASERNAKNPSFLTEFRGFGDILRNRVFRKVAPLSVLCQGVWLAFQGLWAGVWLRQVNGLDAITAATYLLYFATAVVVGNLLISGVADALGRRGFSLTSCMGVVCAGFIAVQVVIALHPGAFTAYLWVVLGLLVSGGIFAYALISNAVSPRLGGRAVSLLNLLATLAGFVMQYAVGLVLELWQVGAKGAYPLIAHQTALGGIIVVQIVALIWFFAYPAAPGSAALSPTTKTRA